MLVHVGCEFVQQALEPTHAIVQVEPRPDGVHHVVDASLDSATEATSSTYLDGYGNLCRRLTFPPGQSVMRFDAHVDVPPSPDPADPSAVEIAPDALPNEVLRYTLPSRFCPSDKLADAARQLFFTHPPGWGRVQSVVDWVHGSINFAYGSSGPMTDALDVFNTRQGVCRDFAHLGVAMVRALNIPARYAFGYLPDIDVPPNPIPMDFYAWMEVYLGGRWWTFDPRNGERRKGRVLIGRGLDALDVAMVSSYGQLQLDSMTVWAEESNGAP
ncbi:MAG: transglutaminase family protein [Actinomycetota bacterium]|nr:transglutaminase family protein [Actinomycetota bacterium]